MSRPGQAMCIPRGAVHRFDNFGDQDATVLVIASPALIGPEYFRELAMRLRLLPPAGRPIRRA